MYKTDAGFFSRLESIHMYLLRCFNKRIRPKGKYSKLPISLWMLEAPLYHDRNKINSVLLRPEE